MSVQIPDGPFCTALGCTSEADVWIDHTEHGERPACADCADGHEVVRDV